MLTGAQIAAARRLANIDSQLELARRAGVGRATVARAEAVGDEIPRMGTDAMVKIILVLERAGVVFQLDSGSLAGAVSMKLRRSEPT
jgi:transcriptional regulator with XRE-family HTH domain